MPAHRIALTGNTVIDALLDTLDRRVPVSDPAVALAQASPGPLVAATLHRRESHGAPLREVALGVRSAELPEALAHDGSSAGRLLTGAGAGSGS